MAAQGRIDGLEKEIEGVLGKLRTANHRHKARPDTRTDAARRHWQAEYNRLASELREAYNEKGA